MLHVEASWLMLSCFGLTIVSALVPWVNAEIILLSFVATASSQTAVIAFVIVATLGQMLGKCVLFWTSRHGARQGFRSGRVATALHRFSREFVERPVRASGFVLVSSAVGIPPFFLVTIAAGALRMNFGLYCVLGSAGRLVRFSAIAMAAHAVI